MRLARRNRQIQRRYPRPELVLELLVMGLDGRQSLGVRSRHDVSLC